MASSYSTSGRIELQATGENLNTWGAKVNDNALLMLEELATGNVDISLTTSMSLSTNNGTTDQARQAYIKFTDGGLSGVPTVTIPAVDKVYWMENAGATYAITITCGGTTGSVPVGRTCLVRCDGTDVFVTDYVALTAADVALTNADVVSTNADVVLASQWASLLTSQVAATDYSSKEWAIGDVTAGGGSAKAWAIDASAPDGASEKSAKTYAGEASTSASNAATSETNAATSASNAATSETNAAASAAGVNLPAIASGDALKNLRANAGETAFEVTKQVTWFKGADVASATALVLGTDGNYFDITGTTTITSITTVAGAGVVKLHFDGALTLTHHATNLILPGAANITTAAGDEAEFVEYASGTWRCTNYSKASGAAVASSSGMVLLSTQTVSSPVAAVDFTTGINSTYDEYIIKLQEVIPVTDSVALWMRTSTNAGSSFDSGASDYKWSGFHDVTGGTTHFAQIDEADAAMQVAYSAVGSDSGEQGVSGDVKLIYPSAAKIFRSSFDTISATGTANEFVHTFGMGFRLTAADVDAIRFLFSSGNIESGIFRLYGVSK